MHFIVKLNLSIYAIKWFFYMSTVSPTLKRREAISFLHFKRYLWTYIVLLCKSF